MARAEAKDTTPTEDAIANAGDAMMLLISRSVWDVLLLQAEGEGIRQQLAIFLHGKHARTVDTLHARATPEPDSLGG